MNGREVFHRSAALILPLAILACGSDTFPEAPVAATPRPGTVSGVVRGIFPLSSRFGPGHRPLPSVRVSVIAGAATGLVTTTDPVGAYSLALPEGVFRLSYEAPGFVRQESPESTIRSGEALTLREIILRTAPWAVAGSVRDSRGNPVPNATVVIRPGDAFDTTWMTEADSLGRYRFESSHPHWDYVNVSAFRDGYEFFGRAVQAPCCLEGEDTPHDVHLARIVSITPPALPRTLRVGESVEYRPTVVHFDNGQTRGMLLSPVSSAPSVAKADIGGPRIRGLMPGLATLRFSYRGVNATVEIRVVP